MHDRPRGHSVSTEDHTEREADALAARALAGTADAAPGAEGSTSRARPQAGGDDRSLDPTVRAFFERRFGFDFGGVRLHADAGAARAARAFGAQAFTVGKDVVFGAGQYAPGTREGDRLIAHELAHVVQQSRPGAEQRIARRADPAAVAQMAPSAARANPDYIDNGITLITFYSGEQADIHYADGAVLRLGLIPRWIEPPIQSVDYHSARADFGAVEDAHSLGFVADVRRPRPGMTLGQVLATAVHVGFSVEPKSGRIVPNHVNPVTAPHLCEALRQAEAEWNANFDQVTQGMVRVLSQMKIILELEMMRGSVPAGGSTPAGAAGGRLTSRAAARAAAGTTGAAEAFDAVKLAEELHAGVKALGNPGRMMLEAAKRLSGTGGLSAAQKAKVILEFFRRIGFGISKEGVVDAGDYVIMKSEDSRYAFKFIKATGKIIYGKITPDRLAEAVKAGGEALKDLYQWSEL